MNDMRIATGDSGVDRACELAQKTLFMNVSEKWGTICPVVAPAWGKGYPAWVHSFDNFWMNKVTPYLHTRERVEWPIELLSRYQWPSGMSEGGIHDCDSPEAYQAYLARMGAEWIREQSVNNGYLRDHLYIMQVHDHWWHYGDMEFARRLFPSCRKALDYVYSLKDDDGDGLVETADIMEDVLTDSSGGPSGPKAVERFVEQSMLFGALKDYEVLANALGEKAEADRANERSEALVEKVNDLYWNDKGYYQFAIDAKTHNPLHAEVTSTYGNGYAVLWGLVPPDRVSRLLDYFTSWEFEVPGPILLPPMQLPIKSEADRLHFSPGYYVNGGCGWGRGYLPSICLALFIHGKQEIAASYLQKMAKAANKAGAFYEFWTWEKYTGSTEPQGCKDYSETASAFLDGVIHGYFGLAALEPGWRSVRFAPKPVFGRECSITVDLPGGSFSAAMKRSGKQWKIHLSSEAKRNVEVALPGKEPVLMSLKGERSLQV